MSLRHVLETLKAARNQVAEDREAMFAGAHIPDTDEIPDPDDAAAIQGYDSLLAHIGAAISWCDLELRRPDPLGDALNTGGGTYRP